MMVFSLSMVFPFMVSAFEGDTYTASSFMAAFFFTLIVGIALWLPTRKDRSEIRLHEGFLIVALFWIILGIFGSIPFLMLPERRSAHKFQRYLMISSTFSCSVSEKSRTQRGQFCARCSKLGPMLRASVLLIPSAQKILKKLSRNAQNDAQKLSDA